MYSIKSYGSMVTDEGRMAPYAAALRRALRPGCVVLDIGAGPGIFALLAAQWGARRVFAVEPDDSLLLAKTFAGANGLADRIEFFQDLSTRIELAEHADVIISDLRGVMPLWEHHLPSIIDARRRHLAPGGVLIPQRDRLWAAPVELPKIYERFAEPWDTNAFGLDLRAGKAIVANTWQRVGVGSGDLLASPAPWLLLDYTTVEQRDVRSDLRWVVGRPGVGHGFVVWFDAVLLDEIGFSNAPGQPELIYGQAFFPWLEAVPLAEGDVIEVVLQADLTADDYQWRWSTQVSGRGGGVRAAFKQSTFFGAPLSPAQLHRRATQHRPELNLDGQLLRFVLTAMDGRSTVEAIAEEAMATFPGRFATRREAVAKVGDLAMKYSR